MNDLSFFAKKLLNEQDLALICHVRPDGDTLGSALALKTALIKAGKKVEVYCADPVPERFFFIDEFRTVKSELASDYQAVVSIDCADVTRLGDFQSLFTEKINTYNLDHHVSNNGYGKVNYVVDRASNCENVYWLIKEMGIELDQKIASLLMVGIITDTSIFRHKNTTPETLKIAGELLELGAPLNEIQYNMYYKQTKNRAKLLGLVASKIRYFYDEQIAIATVFKSQIEESGAKEDETEGFIDFVMGIDTVKIGICLLEMDNGFYKVSLRSKGADVNAVARMFGGGGHTLASGCKIKGEYEEVVDKLRFASYQYLEE